MRQVSRFLSVGGVLLLSVAAMAIPATSADAGPPPPPEAVAGPPADAAMWERQDKLLDYSAWLKEQPGADASGYVASVDDVNTMSTQLLWHGKSSLRQRALNEADRRGITAMIRDWDYSQPQIDAAVAATWRQIQSNSSWSSFKVTHIVGLDPTRPGLSIEGDWSPSGKILSASQKAQTRVKLAELASAAAAVKVTVQDGLASHLTTTRGTDLAPLNAGGYMQSPSTSIDNICSSGFSINYGGPHTITAQHCNRSDWTARDGTTTYGTTVATSPSGQARVLSKGGSSIMFDGTYNTNITRHVVSLVDVNVGSMVCTSGGNTGSHCNVKVTALSVSLNDGISTASNILAVQQTTGAISSAQGDSGGTVFTYSGSDVRAAGMIQAGQIPVTCPPGAMRDPGNICSKNVLFTSTRTIINSLPGSSLVT